MRKALILLVPVKYAPDYQQLKPDAAVTACSVCGQDSWLSASTVSSMKEHPFYAFTLLCDDCYNAEPERWRVMQQ